MWRLWADNIQQVNPTLILYLRCSGLTSKLYQGPWQISDLPSNLSSSSSYFPALPLFFASAANEIFSAVECFPLLLLSVFVHSFNSRAITNHIHLTQTIKSKWFGSGGNNSSYLMFGNSWEISFLILRSQKERTFGSFRVANSRESPSRTWFEFCCDIFIDFTFYKKT